jgi:hypothetical protein
MEDIIGQILVALNKYPAFVLGWTVFSSVVAIASVIVKLTKTPKDDEIVGKILRIMSLNKK